jgi:diguanylate cyclase (GGDEF)-like protein
VLWSGETVALFGSAAVEHRRVPRDCLALVHPQDRRQLRRAVVQALKSGGSLELEVRIRQPDGSERWLDCRGQVVDRTPGRRRIIGTVMDVTERRAATEALAHSDLHDMLTGLANRRLMYERLEQSLVARGPRGAEVGLLVIDLDRFKEVNDTLGHHAGDTLLCQVSRRVQSVLEPAATLGRLGGDEFGVVVPSTDETRLRACAERVLEALAAPFVLEGRTVSVGASIGLALAPSHAESAETLLRCADAFMYAAKRGGGGLSVASPSPTALASLRAGLDAAVARAA